MSAGFFVVLPWEPGKVTGVFVRRPLKSVLDLVKDRDPEFEWPGSVYADHGTESQPALRAIEYRTDICLNLSEPQLLGISCLVCMVT